jgi:hypothetical protein
MRSMVARRGLATAMIAASACAKPARVTLAMTTPGACDSASPGCGCPRGATGLRVIAFGPSSGETARGVPLSGTTELSDLPIDTEQIAVEVVGDAGVVIAQGKTAPLDFARLPDGASLPIFMAPPDGFCATGDLSVARAHPLVARAGAGVLVVGGVDAAGAPLATAEYYDPARAAFVPVAVPATYADFTGGVATALPDGTVVLTGTPRGVLASFDPSRAPLALPEAMLFEARTHHGAIGLDARTLFIAGGCDNVPADPSTCSVDHSTDSYVVATVARTPGPNLRFGSTRFDAALIDLGIAFGGPRRYALTGGIGDAGAGDRFALDDAATTPFAGLAAQVVALDGGALLAAFAPDASAPDGRATVLAPDADAPVAIASAPPLSGARLIALEDGTALAVGGDPAGGVARYDPTANAWMQHAPPGDGPGAIAAPTLVRLADGSVLVLGGAIAGAPTAQAWIYRPSLVGPQTGAATALPFGSSDGVLVVPDPTTATRSAQGIVLTAPDDSLSARALVGGPRMTTGRVTASVRVTSGGVALIAQQLGPGRALVAHVVPGAALSIERLDGAARTTTCSGAIVAPFDAAGATIALDVHGGSATVSVDGVTLLACDLARDADAGDRGQWGVAADGVGAIVEVVTIATSR